MICCDSTQVHQHVINQQWVATEGPPKSLGLIHFKRSRTRATLGMVVQIGDQILIQLMITSEKHYFMYNLYIWNLFLQSKYVVLMNLMHMSQVLHWSICSSQSSVLNVFVGFGVKTLRHDACTTLEKHAQTDSYW